MREYLSYELTHACEPNIFVSIQHLMFTRKVGKVPPMTYQIVQTLPLDLLIQIPAQKLHYIHNLLGNDAVKTHQIQNYEVRGLKQHSVKWPLVCHTNKICKSSCPKLGRDITMLVLQQTTWAQGGAPSPVQPQSRRIRFCSGSRYSRT